MGRTETMKHNTYSRIGWTPLEDGRFYITEMDWNYVHERLAPKALASKGGKIKIGPFRIRISKTKN